jgi:hypothetical protein
MIWGGRHAVLVRRWGVVDSAVGLRPFEEADLALLARFAVDPAFSKPFEWAAYRSHEALRRRSDEDGFPERDPRQLVVADAEDTGLGWVMWRDPNLGDGIDIETVRWPSRLGECRASLHGGGRTSAGDSTRGAYAGWPAMLDSLLANRAAQPDQWARPGTESSRSGLRRPDPASPYGPCVARHGGAARATMGSWDRPRVGCDGGDARGPERPTGRVVHECWAITERRWSEEPAVDRFTHEWDMSVTEMGFHLRDFRRAFPAEHSPTRIMRDVRATLGHIGIEGLQTATLDLVRP